MAAVDAHVEFADQIRPLLRSEYDELVKLGVFEGEPIELLEGVLVEMSPEGRDHAGVVRELLWLLTRGLPDQGYRVGAGNPFAASDRSEPQPDIAIVPTITTSSDHPREAHLLIEVSHSSRRRDLGPKAQIYAAAGVPEYWMVDLIDRVVHRHTEPTQTGFRRVTRHAGPELLDACGVQVDLAWLFALLDD